jgi:hypothetical protein
MNQVLPVAVVTDDRTPEEVSTTTGYVVATDRFLSGEICEGRSLVACPVTSDEDCEAVTRAFHKRPEFLRVRVVGERWVRGKSLGIRSALRRGDHLHIYNTQTSFRPEALRKQCLRESLGSIEVDLLKHSDFDTETVKAIFDLVKTEVC